MAGPWEKFSTAKSPFDTALEAEGVSGRLADVARSIYQQESGGGANTSTSNAGAVGHMQVIPATFNRVADQGWDIRNPEHNIRAGLRYIKMLEPLAGGDPALIGAGYYGGEVAIQKAQMGQAVRDPRNPNAPDTLQYGKQVASRLPADVPRETSTGKPWERFGKAEEMPSFSDVQAGTAQASELPRSIGDRAIRAAGLGARAAGPVATGAAVGAAVGAPLGGIGAVPGALVGAGAMGLTQFIDNLTGMRNIDKIMDRLGLPKPENSTERVTQDVLGMMAGQGGLTATGRVLAESAGPVVSRIGGALAANPTIQMAGAAGAGAAGGATREAGGGNLAQFGASVAGGLGAAGATALAQRAYGAISGAIGNALRPKQTMTEINATLNQILSENGIDISKVPPLVRSELASEVKKALDVGAQIKPDVVRRIADYAAVGATPTRGQVTLDPVQITRERNLAKIGANSSDPRLQELAQIQNKNNATFINNLNDLGANTANADATAAGGKVIGALSAQDAAAKAGVDKAYGLARDNLGRAAPMDAAGFSRQANLALDEGMLGAYLPNEVKTILNNVSTGKIPFNVNTAVQIDSVLSSAQRSAGMRSPQALAIGKVREALNSAGIADNVGESAMRDFNAARAAAKARFKWQESSPAIAAALDDPNPDKFVKNFIISGTDKSSNAAVSGLVDTLKKDPSAMQAVKENIAAYLKGKALSGGSDEVGQFSQSGFNRALRDIGDRKLALFFKPEEITQLKTLGRVSSYEMVQPKGSAVNNSNTASAVSSLLDKIAGSSLVGRLPLGDAMIRQPAGNWSAQIGGKQAFDTMGAISARTQAPREALLRLENILGPGFLLANPRSNSGNDNARN